MNRTSTLQRKTPLKGSGFLRTRTAIKRKPRKKIQGYHDKPVLDACRGESCYLNVRGVCRGEPQWPTVVPCHGNWSDLGKGAGIKAKDEYTVPGCFDCHQWLDVLTTATRDEKRSVFFDALARWEPVREIKLNKEQK